jgi:hypothetical protein
MTSTSRVTPLGLALLGCLSLVSLARGGGGPENLFLVVSARSPDSIAVANHYAQLRRISPVNLLLLDWTGGAESIPVDVFRDRLLRPALAAMAERGVGGQIDYLVYSADFPTAIDLSADGEPPGVPADFRRQVSSIGSTTGMTFLWQLAMARSPNYRARNANQYARQVGAAVRDPQSRGFRSWQGWGPDGALRDGGLHYLLSATLAVTGTRGNTMPEIISYLQRSAAADGTRPKGTIYYVQNPEDERRSRPRHELFAEAVRRLRSVGVAAEVLSGEMPAGKRDVQGVMLGVARFDWSKSASTILPGAFCDHFTSFGGVLRRGRGGSQTPLTEFLRHGAAGASGTVDEPLAILDKFPHPLIHYHYAHGCSLAEAFYQSVPWPYQTLLVGDPLCRPWARIPQVSVAGVPPGGRVSGTITLRPSVAGEGRVARFELFVDGVRRAKCAAGEAFSLDTSALCDGHHELRVVAIDASPVETQGRAVLPITVDNSGRKLSFAASVSKTIRTDQSLIFTAQCPGAEAIEISHHHRPLGTIQGEKGRLPLSPKRLGLGPVTVTAVAYVTRDGERRPYATARPVELNVLGPSN